MFVFGYTFYIFCDTMSLSRRLASDSADRGEERQVPERRRLRSFSDSRATQRPGYFLVTFCVAESRWCY